MGIPTRLVLRGYHGKLYHDGEFLAQVPEWSAAINVTNADIPQAGEALVAGALTGYSQTLTFTETHIVSHLLRELLEHLQGRQDVSFEFAGELERPDGSRDYFTFRGCEPEGTIDVASVSPGSVLNRGWSFRVNEPIDPVELLGDYV
jgi:hypothetical protein